MKALEKIYIKLRTKKFLICIILSLVIHFLFIFKYGNSSNFLAKLSLQSQEDKVRIALIDKSKYKQIVDSEEIRKVEKSVDSKFSSRINQEVKKETIAKNVGNYKRAGKGSLKAQIRPKTSKIVKQPKRKVTFKDLQLSNFQKMPAIQQNLGIANGDEKSHGEALRSDHIDKVALGNVTKLNTSENMFYGFMTRFKRQIEGHWRLNVQNYLERGKYGRMPASAGNDYTTNLTIILDTKGNIKKILVNDSSGIVEIDEIAVTSIKRIGAFPNPPKQMAKNGKIEIPFGFRLY